MIKTEERTAQINGVELIEIDFNRRFDLFYFMREKTREICQYYQTDVAIDIEFIMARKYEEPERDIDFIWQIGEMGTHHIWLDSEDFSEVLDNVYYNYPKEQGSIYYHLKLTREAGKND